MRHKTGLALILFVAMAATSFGQLFNGSFEGSGLTGGFNPLYGGSTAIPGWTVGDLDQPSPPHGNDSVDLSGYAAGSVSQTFATVPGTTYTVTFDMSANPDGGAREYTMTVDATGNAPQTYAYDTGAKGNSPADMKWETMTYVFTATGASTTLTFSDATPPEAPFWFGPALDNVRLEAAPTPVSGYVCHRNFSKGKASFKTLNMTDPASYADHIGHGDVAGPCPVE